MVSGAGVRDTGGRVLMVSYNYPPVGTIGSLRITKLASRLPRHGWEPAVLCVSRDRTKPSAWDRSEGVFPGVKVIHAPFPDLLTAGRKALVRVGLFKSSTLKSAVSGGTASRKGIAGSMARSIFAWAGRWATFPDRYLLWLPSAVCRGLLELRSGGYSIIYSTSPPLTNHLVAALLQRLAGLPWVADLRDPWVHGFLPISRFQARIHRLLERLVLGRAAAVIAVYRSLAEEIRELCGDMSGTVLCISNGYDASDYPADTRVIRDRFVLTFTGSVFGLKQDPTVLMEVLEELVAEGKAVPEELLVRFYGPPDKELVRLKERLQHPGIVEINGVVHRTEAIRRQCESTALLVLLWDNPYTAKYFGGKVFEYLGARRPILAWCPAGGGVGDLLARTSAGVAVSDRDGLKGVLEAWLKEFRETGTVAYRGNAEEVESYSWERRAETLAGLLDSHVYPL